MSSIGIWLNQFAIFIYRHSSNSLLHIGFARIYVFSVFIPRHHSQSNFGIVRIWKIETLVFSLAISFFCWKGAPCIRNIFTFHFFSKFGHHFIIFFVFDQSEFVCDHAVDLYELADCLSQTLPTPSTLVTDSGLTEVILPTNVRFAEGVNCIHPTSQGAMGFALPAAIGAQYAKSQPVVVVVGDGSIMMNLQELESIRYQKLAIKIIVVNNNGYAIIRRRQQELFRHRTIGTDSANGVSCPDFERVADCFGLPYSRIDNPAHLEAGLRALLVCDGPALCEVMGRANQGYIELGQARSVRDQRFTRRPLEDQQPYISRELFLNEMIVEPIDQ